ncbi:glycoside hydrolase family 5 protein [Asticcacaulis machinosus]|uniref:Cellulase family glycosylhydrolase n=1 Tax=Asticcacaulis machinosus TaxID=2984211 RepID=A0ABT5HGR8_9CAUL|nr:cellulase family glycosylhydrolase [Asticcacaulis machinosus]MDC7675448.1 cellulase family glycosylhydrolase [Asticcacaulis machinosus]
MFGRGLKALALTIALTINAGVAQAADLITFWDTPQHGGNSFNGAPPDQAYFNALSASGATWVRLTFSKWKPAGNNRDFLIGNADDYRGLSQPDLKTLTATLDRAHAAGLKVVIAPLSLPGSRWAQQTSDGKYDNRLWQEAAFQHQATQFWVDLATALKDHPAVAAYNLINEPVPEFKAGLPEHSDQAVMIDWYARQQGTLYDLPAFYDRVITAIRAVDPATPVMVDSGWYANARSFDYWPSALNDTRVLYAFHMYEPYEATSAPNMKRNIPHRYPGANLQHGPRKKLWDKTAVKAHIDAPYAWAAARSIAKNRIVAGEFGCMRQWTDCAIYLEDVLSILDGHKAHWAFYSFREDVWDGMDYELNPAVKSGQFYWLMEQGKGDQLKRDGPLFEIIRKRLKPTP